MTEARYDAAPTISRELSLPPARVAAVMELLGQGCTVPFIARYRKEITGGLDEVQIRAIQERRAYLEELEERRGAILASIAEQGALTEPLRAAIAAATTKAELEDLYLPFRPKRRTRAKIARERGLEPLAQRVLAQPTSGDPRAEAAAFVDPDKGVPDVDAALQGARDIVAEVIAERADLRALVRGELAERGELVSKRARGANPDERTKFEQYYDHREPVAKVPSHRYLAIRRGESENVLAAAIEVDADRLAGKLERAAALSPRSPFAPQLSEAVRDSMDRLLLPSLETEVRADLKQRADRAAIDVFGENLRNLLLAAPLGGKRVIGIDPGIRTGCKCVAVDETGAFGGAVTVYLTGDLERARASLLAFIREHRPLAIAIGNGTGGREAEAFARDVVAKAELRDVVVVPVSEAGASVYSASDVAREEFPDLDLTLRGAISIARRLQDPLAELVKIEPKAIGVGQYQHDVSQPLLGEKLGDVVESCVNHVGVLLDTASASLLAYVAGIGAALAKKIVSHRERHGAFRSRKQLLDVSGLGPRAFEQAAGFLRIREGEHPLDGSAVHPERYPLVERMARDLGVKVAELVGNADLADRIQLSRYIGDGVGEPTLRDILGELKKPGRDPRKSFEPPRFRDDVRELSDLSPGMVLEGVVTNVTAFGAFVDVGVHQDGLVHVSQLADRFVKDPAEVVRVGDRIRVRVLDVDLARKRIALSAKSGGGAEAGRGEAGRGDAGRAQPSAERAPAGRKAPAPARPAQPPAQFSNNPFAKLKADPETDPKSKRKERR